VDMSRSPFGRERFVQTGRLPMSRETTGSAYRWHNPKYFWSGDKFFQTFENGPWKWEAQQRYAGKNLNCGHYFAVTPGGATAEASYYGLDLSNLQLLEIKGHAESVLDLTHGDNILELAKMAFKNFDDIPDDSFFMVMLSAMTDECGSGGNVFTDYIGYWAQNKGYDGVMFFGARALAVYPDIRYQIRSGKDDFFGQNVAYAFFERIRRTYDLINVVYFSTPTIVRACFINGFGLKQGTYV